MTKKIVLAAAFLLCAVLAVLLLVLLDGKTGDAPGKEGGGAPREFSGRWGMFRGGPSLRGLAGGTLELPLALLWRFETKGPVRSSAAIDGGRVFIGSDDKRVYALDLGTGRKLWSYETDEAVEASPLVLDGAVYAGSSGGFVYAIRGGELLWKYETGDKIVGGANWVEAPGGSAAWILVGSYDGKLHCVDARSGLRVWAYDTDNYVNGAPAVAGDAAVFGGCDAYVHVVALADGSRRAAIDSGAYIAGSAAVADGRAYVGNYEGQLFCVDTGGTASAGNRIVWTYSNEGNPFLSSPAVDGSRVVVGSQDMRVHCVSRDSGSPLWAFPTGGEVDGSPAICGEKVVVGSADGKLYAIRLSDGTALWSFEIGESIASSPAVADGIVVVGADDGWVYAFGPPRRG